MKGIRPNDHMVFAGILIAATLGIVATYFVAFLHLVKDLPLVFGLNSHSASIFTYQHTNTFWDHSLQYQVAVADFYLHINQHMTFTDQDIFNQI